MEVSCKITRFPSSTLLPFFFWGPLLKPNCGKKGALIIKGLLGNLDYETEQEEGQRAISCGLAADRRAQGERQMGVSEN